MLPSFAESQFQHIRYRQIDRTNPTVLKYSSCPSRYPNLSNDWEFAGWGNIYYVELQDKQKEYKESRTKHLASLLGPLRATSISGNDLVASVLYSVGPCIVQAGQYAPISMLLVCLIMYPVKKLMTEVLTALPLNGGTYNAMLHTTSKWIAAVAACFSVLDYLSTCGVSASTAAAYLAEQVTLPSSLTPFVLSLIIIIFVSLICLLGLRESSTVSLAIFILHLVTMAVLMIASLIQWGKSGNAVLVANWNSPPSSGNNPVHAIFNGFCVGLLGVTGIEAAENYIQDLKPNTFPKVMRNMYAFLCILNPPMTFLVTVLVPISVVEQNAASAISLLAEYATPGQEWLRMWVMVDAVIVLSAVVLTGMIGAVGLITRLASDRIITSFFLKRNRFTGSYHYAIIVFLALNVILCCIVQGDAASLSGVFAVAFLGVLTMYALTNVLMKYKRGRLPRLVQVNLFTAVISLIVLAAALINNIVITPLIAAYFIIYFVVVVLVIMVMFRSGLLLKISYWLFDRIGTIPVLAGISRKAGQWLVKEIKGLRKQPIVFFAKTDEPHVLNKAILYVQANEDSSHIKLVHIYDRIEDIPQQLEMNHELLDKVYPKIQLDLIFIQGTFDPAMVDAISEQLQVPRSFMFIGCPGPNFKHAIGDFDGIRIIML
ncbi:amino acid permease-domain-containing protein [Chlamydoabsidia padenii]|nr:amino acid permease-domain-containing protein [Chlamydoabsidia padenii]